MDVYMTFSGFEEALSTALQVELELGLAVSVA